MTINRKGSGFTIIELTLSLAFISILILLIATTTIQIGTMYQKGVTLKTINQSGRDIVRIMRDDIASSSKQNIAFITSKPSNAALVHNDKASFRLCLGSVSYVGNSAAAIREYSKNTSITSIPLIKTPGARGYPVHLARVEDRAGLYCRVDGSGKPLQQNLTTSNYREMLIDTLGASSVNDEARQSSTTAVHTISFSRFVSDATTKQYMYKLDIGIGTNQKGTIGSDGLCSPPGEQNQNFDNCAISKFNTIIGAGYGK